MKENEDVVAIRADLAEMEDMIDAYLSFAAGEGEEPPKETRIEAMLERLVRQTAKAHDYDISMTMPSEDLPAFPVRQKPYSAPSRMSFRMPAPIQPKQISAFAIAMMKSRSSLMTMVPAFRPSAAPMQSARSSALRNHAIAKPAAPALACRSPAISCLGMAVN